MKTILTLIVIWTLSTHLGLGNRPWFDLEPLNVELGELNPGDDVYFEITAKNQYWESYQTYQIRFYSTVPEWINIIEPSTHLFHLITPFDEVIIKFEGTVPDPYPPGDYWFIVEVYNVNDDFYSKTSNILVSILDPAGVGDEIEIIDGPSNFSELDNLLYHVGFYDLYPPFGDQIIQWDLEMLLYTTEGEYTYKTLTNNCCGNYTYFSFTADPLPQDLIFLRNNEGLIKGKLYVSAYDQDLYGHFDEMEISINIEPAPPFVYTQSFSDDELVVLAHGVGGTNFYLYYDTEPAPPYNGTGFQQGDSPINLGGNNQIVLNGVDNCQTYYFALKAENSFGVSDYSDEISLAIFDPPDQEMVLINLYDLIIPIDLTLTGNYYFGSNLIIQSGASLIIEGGTIYFNTDSKIIIEPGGILTLNGTTLTAPCGQMWQGIEVWGDKFAHQFTIDDECAQGKLILNDASIENAKSAIELWKPGHYSMTGGIVHASNTVFRNNAKSVHALIYKNFHPYNPEKEMNYISSFKNCIFEITQDYPGEYMFYKHVDLHRIKGIDFRACAFTLDNNAQGVSQYNNAIAVYDAGVGVLPVCTSNIVPCAEYDKCTFSGFFRAIYAGNSDMGAYPVFVNDAVFTNNACGIFLRNIHTATLIFNEFHIGYNQREEQLCGLSNASYGIFAENSSMFSIQENEFYKATGEPTGNYVGIRIDNTNSGFDEIYRNTFNGLSYANYTEGKNWFKNDTYQGLAYYCIDNDENYADFYVEKDDNDVGGIQSLQGSTDVVTGNTFSPTADWHFYNNGNHALIYYHCNTCPKEIPDDQKIEMVFKQPRNFNNPCPSNYGGGGIEFPDGIVLDASEKYEQELLFAESLSDYNNVKLLYGQLMDGGNTSATETEIISAWPDEMWELRASLLGKSPHLSEDVLKTMANRNDILPDAVIFEILSANPDELRNEELLIYLEEKENPLPDYMIDILRQVAAGTTYKTVLQQEMSKYYREKSRAALSLVRSGFFDTTTSFDAIRGWLNNLGEPRADELIIATYIKEGNFSNALALAQTMPAIHGYQGNELDEHLLFMDILNLQVNLLQEDRTILDLTGNEVNNLISIAETSTGTAGSRARAILEYAYGYHFCNCPKFDASLGYKSNTVNPKDHSRAYGLDVRIEPNPAKDWTVFKYTLPASQSEATIMITDGNGKAIESFIISGLQGEKVWDTRRLVPGTYFYILRTKDFSHNGKIVVH